MSDKLEAATHSPEPEPVPTWVGEKGAQRSSTRDYLTPRGLRRACRSGPFFVFVGVFVLVGVVGILSAR